MKVRRYKGTTRPPGIHPQIWSKVFTNKERKQAAEEYEEELRFERAGYGPAGGSGSSSLGGAPAAPSVAKSDVNPGLLEFYSSRGSVFRELASQNEMAYTQVSEQNGAVSQDDVRRALCAVGKHSVFL